MAANVCSGISFYHHRHRVPAHDAFDAAFQFAVAGILRFLRRGNGVDVRRRGAAGRARRGAEFLRNFFQHLRGALGAFALQRQFKNRFECGGNLVAAGTVNVFFGCFHLVKLVW